MSVSILWANILNSLEKYKDIEGVKIWLLREGPKLTSVEFTRILDSIFEWLLSNSNSSIKYKIISLLNEFDQAGRTARYQRFEARLRDTLEVEELEKEQEYLRSIQAREEEIAKKERLRLWFEKVDEKERREKEAWELRYAAKRQELAARELRERKAREQQHAAWIQEESARRLRERKERELQHAAWVQAEKRKKELQKKRVILFGEIDGILASDYLSSDAFFQTSCVGIITEKEFEAKKLSFVEEWISNHTPNGKDGTKQLPDNEQLAAIATFHNHIQVVARAGSGKTTTLVNRALFLLKHCRVNPNEILLLAFNKKAAREIRRKLLKLMADGADAAVNAYIEERKRDSARHKKNNFGEIEAQAIDHVAARFNITLPHVMTFHALAYAIVHPEENILYDGGEDENQGKSRVFQQVIDDHLQDSGFREKIRRLMLAHFREDWDRIVEGRYDQSKEELLRFRRSLPRESIGGDYVKSYGEKAIANFLFEHGIVYKYECNHWWSGINYRPDFTIFVTDKSGVIIEYFGLSGDLDYDKMSEQKREYWQAKTDWTLIELSPTEITRNGMDGFFIFLKAELEKHGIPCARLSEEEIWQRVRERAIDRLTKACVGFVGRCRKQSLSPLGLQKLIESYTPLSDVEMMFLEVAGQLYSAYLERLKATGEEDFDGLMQRAAEIIDGGNTIFRRKSGDGDLAILKYISIDEFQDFSDLFHRLLTAIRKHNPAVELFCVGDDWQAINGFAGSDLKFFKKFENYIGKSLSLYISTNYRSLKSVVNIGNTLMAGRGKPAVAKAQEAGTILISSLNEFEPTLIEKKRHPGDILTPAIARLANGAFAQGRDVVMLSRRNSLPWFVNFSDQSGGSLTGIDRFLELVRSFLPKNMRDRISISTAHKYKGLEKSMVIIVDAVARSYPLIHPDWAFSRILGDSPEKITEEERRLFYVALTRAVQTLVILTDSSGKSPFLEELERSMKLTNINWADYPPVSGRAARLVVKIGNQERSDTTPTFAIKDVLKASGYQWQSKHWPCWEKSFSLTEFKIETLQSEIWSKTANGIEVRIFNDTESLVAQYKVDNGRWLCLIDKLESLRAETAALL